MYINLSSTGTNSETVYISDLANADLAPNSTANPGSQIVSSGGSSNCVETFVYTNSAAQIRTRQFSGTATETIRIFTLGWTDTRGRNN